MAENCRVQLKFAVNRARIRVKEQLVGVPAPPRTWIPRAVDPKSVASSHGQVADVRVEDIENFVGQGDAVLRSIFREDTQLDSARRLRP